MTMFEFFNQDAIREQRNNAAVKVQAAARRFLAVRREAGRGGGGRHPALGARAPGPHAQGHGRGAVQGGAAAAADLDEDEPRRSPSRTSSGSSCCSC